jgi:hypothetical protein
MTTREMRRDEQTIAAYAASARRLANCSRTHCQGAAVGIIEHRNGTGTERYDAGHAPGDAWTRRSYSARIPLDQAALVRTTCC